MAPAASTAIKISAETASRIAHYARFPPTALSLAQMAQFGQNLSTATVYRSAQFMGDELPVRLAHRVRELENLPDGLSDVPSIKRVHGWYVKSFEDITAMQKYAHEKIPEDIRSQLLRVSSESLTIPAQKQVTIDNNDGTPSSQAALTETVFKPRTPEITNNNSFFGSLKNKIFQGFGGSPLVKYDGDYKWPEEVHTYLKLFAECLTTVRKRHDAVVTTIAQGIKEYSQLPHHSQNITANEKAVQRNPDESSNEGSTNAAPSSSESLNANSEIAEKDFAESRIETFLDRFFLSRIGIRMLIGQQLALMEGNFVPNYVGIICTNASVREIIQHAVTLAEEICEDTYGLFEGPKVIIECDPNLRFMYIPAHLSHMIFELTKNSLRAVVEKYGLDMESSKYPPVTIVVGDSSENITIKISDKGGGIPRTVQEQVWMYNYTTVKEPPKIGPEFSEPMMGAPMAGFGYGLPITRLYARYFGGDVDLQSVEGFGTDVYMHLNKLSTREIIY